MRFASSIPVHVGLCATAILIVSWAAALQGQDVERPNGGGAQGWLRIEEPGVERLVLSDPLGATTEIKPRGDRVSLPVGSYQVEEIELAGGFRSRTLFSSDDRIEVAADRMSVFEVGLPLTSQVQVRRLGRLLSLDYRLVDGKGRRYVHRSAGAAPPTFTVFKNGRAIGSGTFEYG
jgi:hypothetical protein